MTGVTSDKPQRLLSLDLFERSPQSVAPTLINKVLVTEIDGQRTGGYIVEVEAYLGADDPGSHAATKGVTKRNAIMYGGPARTYVYLNYGIHCMLNIVCLPEGQAGAVLIRAIEPTIGVDMMIRRRNGSPLADLARGPGRLTKALGITTADNDRPLNGGRISIYHDIEAPTGEVRVSGRVGLSAGQDLMLRYYADGSPYVSR